MIRETILYILEDSKLDVPYRFINSSGGDRYRIATLLINYDKFINYVHMNRKCYPLLGQRYTTIYMDYDLANRSITMKDLERQVFRPAASFHNSSFIYI